MNVGFYRKSIFAHIASVVGVAVMSIYINISENRDITESILITLVAIIPFIFTVIPAIENAVLKVNGRKIRLTNNDIFTDRENDLKQILKMLSSKEHIIEIKGKEENCGKTWLAKRLCDYINNPKDKTLCLPDIKIPYKRAFYLNLQDYNEEQLNSFLCSNLILSKDVLIFDHVSDLDSLISKQKSYHFQMIYVMNKSKETNFSAHYISEFNTENMEVLHNKIRKNYPRLDQLSKKDFDKLFELTNGNIGRIASVLSEQKCLKWLQETANDSKTDYEIELDKVQIELFVGHYVAAKRKLDDFSLKFDKALNSFLNIKYKYLITLSDCMHLLNNYTIALDTLSLIETPDYQSYNRNYEIELHKAHYYKHLWNCNEALDILYRIKEVSYSAIVDSLGILAAKYFINDLNVDFSRKNSIGVYMEYYTCAEKSDLESTEADIHKLMRHTAIYKFYANRESDLSDLISHTNQIIDIYKEENNRLLANAYFVQGEIYRLYQEYEKAIVSYKKCLNITHDNNIIIQVNLMVYYLKFIKKVDVDFNIISDDSISKICEINHYADLVNRRIKCINLDDPNANEIITCFDTRIMPIL